MGIEELREQVGLFRCQRCDRAFPVEELTEDPVKPGLIVCKVCKDELGFYEIKRENPKICKHYFK